ASLAADADRGVGEEPHPVRVLVVARDARRVDHQLAPVAAVIPARRRYSSTSSVRAGPRGRRPGTTSTESAFTSWIWELASSAIEESSFIESPRARPFGPQW